MCMFVVYVCVGNVSEERQLKQYNNPFSTVIISVHIESTVN